MFSAGLCPKCPENASCSNSTHCACKDGFQSVSGKKYIEPHEKCEGNDGIHIILESLDEAGACVFYGCASDVKMKSCYRMEMSGLSQCP